MGRVHQGADAEEMEAVEAREPRGGNEGLEYRRMDNSLIRRKKRERSEVGQG